MGKEYFANPQQRLAIKNRQKKVHRYKVYKEYKKALSQEGQPSLFPPATQSSDSRDTGEEPLGWGRPKKAVKLSAVEAARREYASKQRSQQEELEAERQRALERQRQIAAAKKRRKMECVQHKRRTKRGQPVLTQQLSKILSSIEKR